MAKLQLSLKTNWFQLTKKGVKTEDYREINEYWAKRFFSLCKDDMNYSDLVRFLKGELESQYYADNIQLKSFDINKMTLGYPKSSDKERIIELEHLGIKIGTGNPEWGAEIGKLYFIINHGRIIN